MLQVAEELGDEVAIYKVNTEENEQLSSQLQIQGLPTMIFVGTNAAEPALRTEGMMPAASIKEVLQKLQAGSLQADAAAGA